MFLGQLFNSCFELSEDREKKRKNSVFSKEMFGRREL